MINGLLRHIVTLLQRVIVLFKRVCLSDSIRNPKNGIGSDLLLPPIKLKPREVDSMIRELQRAGDPYVPTTFWELFGAKNDEQLNTYGLNNFKRTVNQNYYNWLPLGIADNQLKNLVVFWAKDPNTRPIITKIKNPKFLNTAWETNPFSNEEYADLYCFFVGLLWDYTVKTDTYKISEGLSEPTLGNPIQVKLGDKLISQDLANSIRERNTVCDFLDVDSEKTHLIAELGAGYGRLGYVFLSSSNCKYFIFDIPPALNVSQWYLTQLFPNKKIFPFTESFDFEDIQNEVESSDICFFTPSQLQLFPNDYFDALLSISTLHEMTKEQVESYKKIINLKIKSIVYFKQYIQSHNPFLKEPLKKPLYFLEENWEIVLDRKDPVQDEFFEVVFQKI